MGPVIFSCGGVTYHLLLNGAALFDIYEKFGSKGFVLDHIKGSGKKSFGPTCWMLAKLAEQGELLRRYQGYDKTPIPTEELFRLTLSPMEIPLAKDAIARAVEAGFHREEGERKAVDKGLLEIQKNGKPMTWGQYLNAASQFLGLSVREALLLPVGRAWDLVELELRRRGLKKSEKGA